MREEMRRDPDVLLMGEDIAGDSAAFKATKGFEAEFGAAGHQYADRGAGLRRRGDRHGAHGSAPDHRDAVCRLYLDGLRRYRAVCGDNPLSLGRGGAVGHPRSVGRRNPLRSLPQPESGSLVRPHTGVEGGGACHTGDAKGLMIAAIATTNPVVCTLRSKPLYRSLKGFVPAGEYMVPLG